ncbi:hypothetical protein L596_007409 [Steinernema carpocapsae]|uniref:Uncharacterized protein n=1 Tax=Steinernema carpocapsae TaxID=34508 RepID=A0A4U5P973_STECR|nr:hypothetical protein L596_007409 [Steinernema carpocapsae]
MKSTFEVAPLICLPSALRVSSFRSNDSDSRQTKTYFPPPLIPPPSSFPGIPRLRRPIPFKLRCFARSAPRLLPVLSEQSKRTPSNDARRNRRTPKEERTQKRRTANVLSASRDFQPLPGYPPASILIPGLPLSLCAAFRRLLRQAY